MKESALIGFASLFLGLTTGTQPVELMVDEPVAAVQIVLDGHEVARLDGPPWRTPVDFGPGLVPHRLDAVGLRSDGQPIAEATQWVNVPRGQAEIEVAIVTDTRKRAVGATLAWRAVRPVSPESINAGLDGTELSVTDSHQLTFPPLSLDEPHVLRVVVAFPGDLTASVTKVFGGTYVDTTEAELTAVPLVGGSAWRTPKPARLADTLSLDGVVAPVVATERPSPQIVVVLDERAAAALRDIALPPQDPRQALLFSRWNRAWMAQLRGGVGVGDAEIDMVDTVPDHTLEDRLLTQNLFTCKAYTQVSLASLSVFLARRPLRGIEPELQWLQAATATAGLAAARGNRPRIVILVIGSSEVDEGDYSPDDIRAYLESLHVPLRVWSPIPEIAGDRGGWGPVLDVSTLKRFLDACHDVVAEVDRQFIAWIDGEHLPQTITDTRPDGSPRIAR